MLRLFDHVRSGDWLTIRRIRAYSGMMLAFGVCAAIIWLAMGHGPIDASGRPFGTDFASFYAAGDLALAGRATEAWDIAAHLARQHAIFGAATPPYVWMYPPLFLLIAAPLALLPYLAALTLWQAGTLAMYLGALHLILRSSGLRFAAWWLPALGFPAVLVNVGHGQNGLLTAGLFGAALAVLPARPLLAGVLLGALAYKPQFALAIPIALIAAAQWRAVAGAALSTLTLVALSAWLFGFESWAAFLQASEQARNLLLEQGGVGFEKLQSIFAAVRLWGGGIALAYIVQIAVSLVALAGLALTWRSACAYETKAATLLVITLVSSPHVLDYDLTLLGPALAFMTVAGLRDRFAAFQISAMALAWVTPLVARTLAGTIGLPLGILAMSILAGLLLMPVIGRPGGVKPREMIAQA